MNIYAEEGDKVVFLNKNGHDWEPKQAVGDGLVEGQVYTVADVDISNWMSHVYLKEVPHRRFNTVMFDDCEEDSMREDICAVCEGHIQPCGDSYCNLCCRCNEEDAV